MPSGSWLKTEVDGRNNVEYWQSSDNIEHEIIAQGVLFSDVPNLSTLFGQWMMVA